MTFNPQPRPRPRVLDRRAIKLTKARQYTDLCKAIRTRDGGVCRCCGKRGDQVHHLLYRSHGGKDDVMNCVWICQRCHQDIHARIVMVRWDGVSQQSVRFLKGLDWAAG